MTIKIEILNNGFLLTVEGNRDSAGAPITERFIFSTHVELTQWLQSRLAPKTQDGIY